MKYPVVVLSAFLITVTASGAAAGCAHDKWACGMRAKEKCNGLSDNDRVAQCLEESGSDCESQDQACVKSRGSGMGRPSGWGFFGRQQEGASPFQYVR
jgi:hypothetical protein